MKLLRRSALFGAFFILAGGTALILLGRNPGVGWRASPRESNSTIQLEGETVDDLPQRGVDRARQAVSVMVSVEAFSVAGDPVEGAEVIGLDRDGESDVAGVINASGSVAMPAAQWSRVYVRAPGFRESKLRDVVGDSTISFVLYPKGGLLGRVVDETGNPPAQATHVYAWGTAGVPAPERVLMAMAGNPESGDHVVACDADGVFWLPAASSSSPRSIVAGGAWGCSLEVVKTPQDVRELPAAIVILPVYALAVKVVQQDGSAPNVPDNLSPIGGPSISYPGECNHFSHQAPQLLLAGVDPLFLAELNAADIFFVASCPKRLDRLGPLRVKVAIPGYHPGSRELFAGPLGLGFGVERVVLRAMSDSFGDVLVRIKGVQSEWLDLSNILLGGLRVRLVSADNGSECNYLLRAPRVGTCEFKIEGVPYGTYHAHVNGWDNTRLHIDAGLEGEMFIVAGESTAFTIDGHAWGALEVRAAETIIPADHRATIVLERGRRKTHCFFTGAPFRVLIYEPGEYLPRIEFPPGVAPEGGLGPVSVKPGEVTYVDLAGSPR